MKAPECRTIFESIANTSCRAGLNSIKMKFYVFFNVLIEFTHFP